MSWELLREFPPRAASPLLGNGLDYAVDDAMGKGLDIPPDFGQNRLCGNRMWYVGSWDAYMHGFHRKRDQLSASVRVLLLHCAQAVRKDHPDAQIVLYGSQARGQATPESDVDMLILLDSEVTSQERDAIHDRLYEIGLERDMVISAMIRSVPQWERPLSRATPLYQTIQDEGILVP
jgi:predicted nucleotidyltransferase